MKVSSSEEEFIIYLGGEFLTEKKARVSVFDHLVLYEDGVYDTCCGWRERVFRLWNHINRLYESARGVQIKIPLTKTKLAGAVLETVGRNKLREANIKIVVSRGVGDAPIVQVDGVPIGDGEPGNCIKMISQKY